MQRPAPQFAFVCQLVATSRRARDTMSGKTHKHTHMLIAAQRAFGIVMPMFGVPANKRALLYGRIVPGASFERSPRVAL